jgi:N-hydroxyarylamine O-acetyltransferase
MTSRSSGAARVTFDLDAYLARIGHAGDRRPTLDVLRALHLAHARAIPFENLDPFLHRPVPIDLPSVTAKLLSGTRGGYCFEQNLLFMEALRALGFAVVSLSARVVLGRPADAMTPRTHMLLRVDLDGVGWIADVGFGGTTLTAPVRLDAEGAQETPHGRFRLRRLGDAFVEEILMPTGWASLYRFDLSPTPPVDHEVANHYVSTAPASHFRHRLTVARPLAVGRAVLLNDRLTLYGPDGVRERHTLSGADEAERALRERFGVVVPDAAAFASAFDRALAVAATSGGAP